MRFWEIGESQNLRVWGQLGADAWWADVAAGLLTEWEGLAWLWRAMAVMIPILSD